MEAKATFQEKNIGGIKVYYSKGNTKNALFLLHGRKGSALEFIEKYIQMINVLASLAHVFVIDQRNHGERLLDPVQNRGKDANISHPIDMYAIQLGTAMDLCYLVDAIPLYVPELALDATFAVLGYSLGGHASLLALSHCEKLSICVSVVGCADYLKLMESRDCEIGSALFNLVERKDPINNLKSIVNKHIHLLGGEQDHLVPPWTNLLFSQKLEALRSEYRVKPGSLEVSNDPAAKHEFSPLMQEMAVSFLSDHFTQ